MLDLFRLEPREKPIGKYRYMMLKKRQTLIEREWNYFAQFAGDKLRRYTCDNCGAKFLSEEPAPRDHLGRVICCAHCIFSPMGCRCGAGQFGVAETEFWPEAYEDEFADEDYY